MTYDKEKDFEAQDDDSAMDILTKVPTKLEHKRMLRTIQLPKEISTSDLDRSDQTLRRTYSIASRTSETDVRPRVVTAFRTLSIEVHETKNKADQERNKKNANKAFEIAKVDWHTKHIDDVLQILSVSPITGLDSDQVKRRLSSNGKNVISPPPSNWVKKCLSYVLGGFAPLLIVASILCFIAWKPLGEPNPSVANLALAIVLLAVVVIQGVFNGYQDFSTSRVMASITNMLPAEVLVLRDGKQVRVPAPDLVSGDLVYIALGNKIPADLRLLEVSSDLKLDRSVLTGESDAISGKLAATDDNYLETKNICLAGTMCVSGSGLGVVISTGDNTVFGTIARLSSISKPGMTTLQKEIFRFVLIISSLAFCTALLIVILWSAWLRRDYPDFISVPVLVIDVVSVAVAFIPEGLPMAVTISLAVVAAALANKKVLAKSLSTVETLGAVSVICSDKTGTLTENKMVVSSIVLGFETYLPHQAKQLIADGKLSVERLDQLAFVAGQCNSARFDPSTINEAIPLRLVNGDATDSAILKFAEGITSTAEGKKRWTEVFKLNFNSKSKFMSTLLSPTVESGKGASALLDSDVYHPDDLVLLTKGAPDVLYQRCSSFIAAEGSIHSLTPDALAKFNAIQESLAKQGQRILLLARRIVSPSTFAGFTLGTDEYNNRYNEVNTALEIIGMVGLMDPPRPDTASTITALRRAFIRVFIVTGDFPTTAVAIGHACGIVTNPETIHTLAHLDRDMEMSQIVQYDMDNLNQYKQAIVLTGNDLLKMNESQWEQVCQYEEVVFARTSPEQKLLIVRNYQARSNVVGMTGDGVNDSPALKHADIGIAVGSGASAVACEAADLVLLESFSSILAAVEHGRLVFDNLKKSILYLLPAGSFSELMPVLLNVLIGVPQALSSLQMILICVITDVAPAISMCFEKAEVGIMTRKPRNIKKDRLVDAKLLLHAYGFLGVLESLCAMSMAFWHLQRKGIPFSDLALAYGGYPSSIDSEYLAEQINRAQSVYFFTLVVMQWGSLLATRTRRLSLFQQPPLFKKGCENYYTIPAMIIAVAFAFFFSYVPAIQTVFLTRGIEVEYFFIPLAFAVCLILIDEARKYCVRKYPGGFLARVAW